MLPHENGCSSGRLTADLLTSNSFFFLHSTRKSISLDFASLQSRAEIFLHEKTSTIDQPPVITQPYQGHPSTPEPSTRRPATSRRHPFPPPLTRSVKYLHTDRPSTPEPSRPVTNRQTPSITFAINSQRGQHQRPDRFPWE